MSFGARGSRRRIAAAVLATWILSGCTGRSEEAAPPQHLEAELGQRLDRWRMRDRVVAAALAVDLPGVVSWQAASGWRDRQGGAEAASGDRFRIASVTKTFVAAVVLQLVDEDKISLDDAVKKYVHDAPHSEGVKIEHLLDHTSGIPEAQDVRWSTDALEHPQRPWSRERLLDSAARKPRQHEPGSRFAYSNTNYLLLGDVIKSVTGSDWGQQVRSRIIEPLCLSNTFVSENEIGSGGVVAGYVDADRDGATDDLFQGPWKAFEDSAGGMISSAPDLVRFGRALFEGQLVRGASLRRITVPRYFTASTGYGLGVQFSRPDLQTTVAGHTGGMPGYSAALMYVPEHRLAIAALANDGTSSAFDLGELAMQAILSRRAGSVEEALSVRSARPLGPGD